jgi:YD repeat-containing protein
LDPTTVTVHIKWAEPAAIKLPSTRPGSQVQTQPSVTSKRALGPTALQATTSKTLQNGQISESVALPDSTSDSDPSAPDPGWGIQVPVNTAETLTRSNLTMNSTGSRSTTLGTAGNPFSVTTETDTRTVNGRAYTATFTGSSRNYLNTSPVGRTLTVGLDSLERVASTQVGEVTTTNLTYDTRGRLASSTQGTRKTTFSYNANGFLASVTDPLKLKTSFAYDADGRVASATFADERFVQYSYYANGNLTSITSPANRRTISAVTHWTYLCLIHRPRFPEPVAPAMATIWIEI